MSEMTVLELAKLMAPPKVVESRMYQLSIKVPYEALDDIQARDIAKGYLESYNLPKGAVVKLQRLEDRKVPVGLPL